MSGVVCYPFVGDSIGGAHLSAIELIKCLDRSHYRPIIVLHEEGVLAEHLHGEGLDYIHLPLSSYAGTKPSILAIAVSAARAAPTLRRFLREESVNLVHCNDLRTNLTWFLASRLAGARFIWHQRTQTLSNSTLWRMIPRVVDHCIAISSTAARPFGKVGTHLSIIDNPFSTTVAPDRNSARQALLAEIGAGACDRLIGFVGRVVNTKRPETCVDLVDTLHKRGGHSVHLLLFGRGADAMIEHLQARAESLGIKDYVHFMGFRYPIQNAIAGLDILVAPSEQEGFGRTLIEAMLVGTPVLASKIEAHCESVSSGVNGVLVPVGDVEAFASATEALLQDRDWAERLSEAAREMARRRFSAKCHAQKVQNLYSSLLG